MLLFYVATLVMLMVAAPIGAGFPGEWPKIMTGLITAIAGCLLTVIFVRWDKSRLVEVGAALTSGSVVRLGAGFAVGAVMVAIQCMIVFSSGHVRWVSASDRKFTPVVLALLAYLLLASREELAFHGYPLRRLQRFWGVWPAQIVVAIAFVLEHRVGGFNWTNALLGASIGSLLFGMASIATRGLAVPIGIHAAWNFGQWVIGFRELPGLWRPIIEEGYTAHVNHALFAGYWIAFVAGITLFWRVHMIQTKREMSTSSSLASA
ncbi:MAG TPA: type II CAAX endopeptidase family protein [Edaphobacter sp.]|nr:type II CAAX endopeptidase family protein [Edaphobacter sp.]